jgi:hypothetical protein
MAMESYRLPDGEEVVFDEWLHWPVYSTIEFAQASGVNLRAFTYVEGSRVPSTGLPARMADQKDTNQVAKSRMNWDETFRVFSMTYEVFGLSAQLIGDGELGPLLVTPIPGFSAVNLARLQRDLMVELIVGADIEKPQVRAPFAYFHQGVGPWVFGSNDSVATDPAIHAGTSHGTGGQPRWCSQRRYPFPIKIGNDRVMYLKVFSAFGNVAGLSQDTRMRWYLDGVKRRPLG